MSKSKRRELSPEEQHVLANAAVNPARKSNPKSNFNTGSFQQRFCSARGGRQRLQALLFAKSLDPLDL